MQVANLTILNIQRNLRPAFLEEWDAKESFPPFSAIFFGHLLLLFSTKEVATI